MRPGMTAAAFGALLFAAIPAVHAAPAANLSGAVQSPGHSVDLVAQGGPRGGGGIRSGGAGKGWSGLPSGGIKPNVRAGGGGGGPKVGARSGGGGKAYRGGGQGRYAGKGPRGGDWNRGVGKRGGYAYKGGRGDKYRYRYFYPGVGLGLGLAYGGAYAYGDDCGWLYRRARATGSPYWWQRFEECRYNYY